MPVICIIVCIFRDSIQLRAPGWPYWCLWLAYILGHWFILDWLLDILIPCRSVRTCMYLVYFQKVLRKTIC